VAVNEPTHVSTFAGIDGIGLGLERAGFRTIASVEINAFCNRVRAKRRPDVAQFGDIRSFGDAALASATGQRHTGRVDVLSGGFPCQDLSVAGKRAGLAGARSGLFYEFIRVARELRPTWLLVENVPGLLSSNERGDFAIVLAELGDAGYFVEWRVLDSRWFGVAQRRRRVFIVGHLGGPSAAPVLFESEGRRRDLASGDEAGQDIAGTLGGGAPGARGWRGDLDTAGAYIPEIGRALTGTMGKHHDPDTDTLVAHTLRASGFDAGEDGTGRGMPLVAFRKSARMNADPNSPETWVDDGIANTLNGFDVGDIRTTHAVVAGHAHERGRRSRWPSQGRRHEPDDTNLTTFYSHTGQDQTYYRDEAPPITSSYPPSVTAASVRRLTPTECERLQGFPDGWTCLCDQTPCVCPDGPRYAALGNAVTVNVAEWIGHRIRAALTDGKAITNE